MSRPAVLLTALAIAVGDFSSVLCVTKPKEYKSVVTAAIPPGPSDKDSDMMFLQISRDATSGVAVFWADIDAAKIVASVGSNKARTNVSSIRMYIGPVDDPKATFQQCTYDGQAPSGPLLIDLCQCTGFVYDPTGLKIPLPQASATTPVFVQPGHCSAKPGVTCVAATEADENGGCGSLPASQASTSASGQDNVNSSAQDKVSALLVFTAVVGYISGFLLIA